MKLFGIDLFSKRRGKQLMSESDFHGDALKRLQESEYLPDFMVNFNNRWYEANDYVTISNYDGEGSVAVITKDELPKKKGKAKKVEKPLHIEVTPKGLYYMKTLDEKDFVINTDKKYIEENIADFTNRLSMIKMTEGDYRNGLLEVASMLIRLENRKQYSKFHELFDKYPYTTTAKIEESLKAHPNLKLGLTAQFVPSFPKEAIKEMDTYRKITRDLCHKDPIFYVIAQKKDFERTNKRKDPILLAQSPFGHFWQIIGAWDDEMILLDEL